MKHAKKLLLMTFLFMGAITITRAQEVKTLPEITVLARNYKYLRSVNNMDGAEPVKILERKAAIYDVKSSGVYEDDYDSYYISFYLPQGYLLAVYDENGKLLRTAERFRNIALPAAVRNAVAKRYPNWAITEDIYQVKFDNETGAQMTYKLLLRNGSKRLKVKADEKREFLD